MTGGAVDEAFRRDDLVMPRDEVFPIEVHWSPKSGSVAASCGAGTSAPTASSSWTTAPGDRRGQGRPARDRVPPVNRGTNRRCTTCSYGSATCSARTRSPRRTRSGRAASARPRPGTTPGPGPITRPSSKAPGPSFTVSFNKSPADPRALELINKTNQFNLNGRRHTEGPLVRPPRGARRVPAGGGLRRQVRAARQGRGRRGAGPRQGGVGRHLGDELPGLLAEDRIRLPRADLPRNVQRRSSSIMPPPRNGPVHEFLAKFSPGPAGKGVRISREAFESNRLPLHMTIRGLPDDWSRPAPA